ncbi:MAG: valine--tRNA ligase [Mycoplasmataceae bacterium]|nr:valine--tRNA ligase [Mycoplasmataceae bacterium]
MEKKYKPLISKEQEENIFKNWKESRIFYPQNSDKPKFSIILPPPNVTGHLHIGHAWDTCIQDCMIRYKKMKGFNTCWIPGTDHAGISAQTKFEKVLKENGDDKKNYSIEEFKNKLWIWVKEQQKYIHSQWERLGLCLAYDFEVFTLDDNANKLINLEFIKLYNDGLIYREFKLTNWDVKQKTAISDLEVINKETKSTLWYFKYQIKGTNEFLQVATTRPETMFVDTNLVVNPKDQRYSKFIGKYAINPINDEELLIISDEQIEIDFGTGVMKLTPAHSFMDMQIAKKNNIINFNSCIELDGKLNKFANNKFMNFEGKDRIKVREEIVQNIKQRGLLSKEEIHFNNIGYSERSGEIVEPLMTKQWFVKMKPIVEKFYKLWNQGNINFLPLRFENNFKRWCENIHDWCISRQLIWGHTIPAWYNKETDEILVSEKEPEEKEKWIKEVDVLDTWFSSGLWPLTTTKYHNDIKNKELLAQFYPISLLSTGSDILTFWVARMFFQCVYIDNSLPIKDVYIHGLIRDKNGIKMSKSLGNVINPFDVIEKYGNDPWRLGILSQTTINGDDVNYSTNSIEFAWSFQNKIINAFNLIDMSQDETSINFSKLNPINLWIIKEYNDFLELYEKNMEKWEFNNAVNLIYRFVKETFCNKYLEIQKKLKLVDSQTSKLCKLLYIQILNAISCFSPFTSSFLLKKNNFFFPSKIEINNLTFDAESVEIWSNVKDFRIKNGVKNDESVFIKPYTNKILELWNIFEGDKEGMKIKNNKIDTKKNQKLIEELEKDIEIYKQRLNDILKQKNPSLYEKFKIEYENKIEKLRLLKQ